MSFAVIDTLLHYLLGNMMILIFFLGGGGK